MRISAEAEVGDFERERGCSGMQGPLYIRASLTAFELICKKVIIKEAAGRHVIIQHSNLLARHLARSMFSFAATKLLATY